jgi:hypothetical protein
MVRKRALGENTSLDRCAEMLAKLKVDNQIKIHYLSIIDIFLLSFGYRAISTALSTNPPFKTIVIIIRSAVALRSSILL